MDFPSASRASEEDYLRRRHEIWLSKRPLDIQCSL
jgi:hypothetical protein